MKRMILVILAWVMIATGYSQKIYRKAQWGINETKTSGLPITRLEGENKVIVITNIGYQSQEQLIAELKEMKKTGRIGGDKYKAKLAEYKDKSVGGMVYLYVERPEPEEGNTKNFKVRLTDEAGNVIQEKQMRTQDSKMKGDGSAYKNDGTVFVNTPLIASFFVEVIEQTSSGEKIYKFKVAVAS
ncbi:MAG: hypothetical protein JKY42_01465 [Flavobacteriales bacterium]|nr:hypothetical protein [Flavobacteriales bacterium]